MSNVRRLIACSLFAAAVVSVAPGAAAAATVIDHFSLDSYHAGKKPFTPTATSTKKLKGQLYVASVQGTFSYYGAINYAVPQAPWTIVCGTPEAAPQFNSAGGSGQVGFDSEFVFARPWLPEPCEQAKLPAKWLNFQMRVGTGTWSHPTLLTAESAPTATHSYEYAVQGIKGHHVHFRLFDIDTRDNYGSLKITLSEPSATVCARLQKAHAAAQC